MSIRVFHCNPFRKLVEPKEPVSIIGVLQGRFDVADVPQVVGKISTAVWETPVRVALLGK